jgi:16S rRNA (guanine966-N2)-methyltransferase
MRVIAGSAKGIRLASVPGKSTRPITDQVKEALFNILGTDIDGSYFLDLFGGTGAVGIEALSRGAEHVVFMDINYQAYKVIQKNLEATGLTAYATVLKKDAFTYLREDHADSFNFVYVAPPQYRSIWEKALQTLDENPDWVSADGTVIVQIHPKEYLEGVTYTNFRLIDRRSYGDTALFFFERISAD